METQAGGQGEEPAAEAVPAGAENLPAALRAPEGETALPEQLEESQSGGGPADSAGPDTAPEEPALAQVWRVGPEEIVAGPNGAPLLRRPGVEDVELAQTAAPSPGPVERGLEELYRRTVQAARPAPQALSAPQPGQSVRLGEPETPRQLTVDELDRAVRRDSRRYDGGLEIF